MEEAKELLKEAKSVASAIDDYGTTFPTELVEYYAKKKGILAKDPKTLKVIALATQEYLSKVLDDAADLTKRVEASGGSKKDSNAMSRSDLTLHMDILAKALQDNGIKISGQQYYPS